MTNAAVQGIETNSLLPECHCESLAVNPQLLPVLTFRGTRDPVLVHLQRVRTFRRGETVISEGEDVGIYGKVVEGILKMVKSLPDGREQVVGFVFPGMSFGNLPSATNSVAIEAATRSTLCYIRHSRLDRLIAGNRQLEDAFHFSTLEALDASRNWMAILASHTVAQRLASFLVMLRDRARTDAAGTALPLLSIPVRRIDLAAYIGTTHETLSRVLHGLQRDGVIRIEAPHRLEIVDLPRLQHLSSGDSAC